MIKLICTKCGQAWYTANTSPNQKCSTCNGDLVEVEMDYNKRKDDDCKMSDKKNNK